MTRRSFRAIRGCLWLVIGLRLLWIVLLSAVAPVAFFRVPRVVLMVSGVASWFLFLAWVVYLARLVPEVSTRKRGWSAAEVVGAFLVPIVNFYRPYQLLRAVDDAMNVEGLAPPVTDEQRDAERGYRDPLPASTGSTLPPLSNAFLGGWWAVWLVSHTVLQALGPVLCARSTKRFANAR